MPSFLKAENLWEHWIRTRVNLSGRSSFPFSSVYCGMIFFVYSLFRGPIGIGVCDFFGSNEQGLSQDVGTGSPELVILRFLCVQFFKGDHNILRLQPSLMNSYL